MRTALVLIALLSMPNGGRGIYETLTPAKTGVHFVHDSGRSPRRYLPESMGPGAAVLDFDNDGSMDLYFVNSGPADIYKPSKPLRNALYRNNGNGTCTDVTEKAGVPGRDYGIGVSTCDFNGDGWTDLFVTNYGRNVLYRNDRNGKFTDVTAEAGLDSHGLYTVAVWFDYDRNGTDDVFVGHFVKYSKELERDCTQGGEPHYCYPLAYDPQPSRLYRNNGDGTFTDVSTASGIAKHNGKTFGAVATDINNDGWLDLFVANDSVPNFLFVNKQNGSFEEIGLDAGVAYNRDGAARSGMGVDAADYNSDGWQDLFVANFNREMFSIYRNLRDNTFSDDAGPTGIATATQMYSGWGVKFFDFDHDGDDDLVVCNGHPDDLIEKLSSTLKHKEPILLFEQTSPGKFRSLGPGAGDAFTRDFPARGLSTGDLNNDGYTDLVIANNHEAPLILRHTGAFDNGWLGLHLKGNATGAIIRWTAGSQRRSRLKTAGGSYLSAHDPREILGLGTFKAAQLLEVQWPDGHKDRFQDVIGNRYYSLRKGGMLQ
ncbi:MAG TPA: CRTAC1 family protein [Bryobacteraceae bacterium]|nr:CRTAC1 family protein [Bryobacteraceae bacterium]